MENKIIGVLLILCAALVFQQGYGLFTEQAQEKKESFKTQIEKDILKSLSNYQNKLPDQIHHISLNIRSRYAQNLLNAHPISLKTNPDGNVWLEVEVLDLPDEKNPGVITQVSLFEVKTKNKIGEFGETYYLKDFSDANSNSDSK